MAGQGGSHSRLQCGESLELTEEENSVLQASIFEYVIHASCLCI